MQIKVWWQQGSLFFSYVWEMLRYLLFYGNEKGDRGKGRGSGLAFHH